MSIQAFRFYKRSCVDKNKYISLLGAHMDLSDTASCYDYVSPPLANDDTDPMSESSSSSVSAGNESSAVDRILLCMFQSKASDKWNRNRRVVFAPADFCTRPGSNRQRKPRPRPTVAKERAIRQARRKEKHTKRILGIERVPSPYPLGLANRPTATTFEHIPSLVL